MNWISVEDRLPEIICKTRSKNVLVLRDCGESTLLSCAVTFMWGDGYYEEERWYEQESMGYRVTHWMPLPEPPE